MLFNQLRALVSVVAVALALIFLAGEAYARAGSGFSSGSRGTRTFSAPATTTTAPRQAAPMQRTMTQPGQSGSLAATRPATSPFGGLFGGGLLGGLAAGFLGAGLFGLLFGHGFLGGLGGFASLLGLILQVALVVFLARLAWNWLQRREQPAFAGGPNLRDASASPAGAMPRMNFGGLGGGAASAPVEIRPDDFNAFERLLGEIQTAYGAEDLAALRSRVTPEMLSYFSEDLAQNASRGVVNKVANVKLLQGDLAEAWREGDTEYATVAMRFSLTDYLADRASGRVVEGDERPQEATELWTFRRSRGGEWMLSAIQQTQ
jgi:predicted lipid-binding transport protein (Tim44 family)